MDIKFSPLFSGSSGNAVFIRAGDISLLIDAGCNGSAITGAINAIGEDPRELTGILITHEHSDHIRGAGVLSRMLDIPIYANEQTWFAMENKIGKVAKKNICIANDVFYLKNIEILPFNIPHDSAKPQGYRIFYRNKSVAVATDMGHFSKHVLSALSNADLVLLEANHDVDMLKRSSYPNILKQRILGKNGHLSNESAADACLSLVNSNVSGIILGHLSQENNTEQLAYSTVLKLLEKNGVKVGQDLAVGIALRNKLSGNFFV